MKVYILIFTLLITGLFSDKTLAQSEAEHESRNYIVITRNIEQLQPILLTAEALAEEDGENFGAFEVVVCGKTVVELVQEGKLLSWLKMAEEADVEVKACGFSLNKFKVNPQDLPTQIKVIENGLLYSFQLQKKGYLSIEL
ncbi:sulfur reduction protein DsrE [Catalinimonas niigatensis]|uniref:sulfur reduction protein DsrE n=1 Tax=Catalinimonas niigatensis TaxID=1397264 RepID=UPI002666BECF|nr:sulfur reduction protein DsrE [Catalinimonas niigatensis]WPP49708.1 sulfur reduction protein DsrE [Catalinimonas niigatensis]